MPSDVLPRRVDAMPSARQSERNQQQHHRPVRRAGEQLEEELANLAARPHHTAETASTKKKEAHHELNAARMLLVDVVTELASCNVIKTRTRAMSSQGEPATQAKFRTRAVSSQDFANQPTMTCIIRCLQRVSLIGERLVHQVALPRARLFDRFRGHSVNACPDASEAV